MYIYMIYIYTYSLLPPWSSLPLHHGDLSLGFASHRTDELDTPLQSPGPPLPRDHTTTSKSRS